jgi:signal transduction histidine kinase
MTGSAILDWALIALSVFNVVILLWLGLTVLLNAERRSWGVWLMGMGLMLGSAFFVSHTAILGFEVAFFSYTDGLNFWWQIGWIPVIAAPFAWYIVTLWYAGFWRAPRPPLRLRHRGWLALMTFMGFTLLALILTGRSIPSFVQIIEIDFSDSPGINGIPLLFLLFPTFMVSCILLSMDVLRRPEPADRLMGDLARERSRPWLMGTATVLLIVSLLVTIFIFQVVSHTGDRNLLELGIGSVASFDLVMVALIALSCLLLGQAVVSYEVFTGKTLPRRGFHRQWRNAVILAAGYGLLIGWSLVIQLRPVYSLLLTALMMAVFYALHSWRSFAEREQFMARLRPFVSNQGLFAPFGDADDDPTARARRLFVAVCRDLLGVSRAQLLPLGGMASLAGAPLVYPADEAPALLDEALNTDGVRSLDPALYHGLRWAIPLWAARGRSGLLLLGEKTDGGLYTQEEIEIAEASGQQIIDMLAGEQMARRLVSLQRGRLAESRVMDRRTRRALHDETLPALHATLLHLSSLPREEPAVRDAIASLTTLHRQVSDLIHSANSPARLDGDVGEALRNMVEREFAGEFNSVTWDIRGTPPELDSMTQEVVVGAAREAVRNAALHGRGGEPERPLNLVISLCGGDDLSIVIQDNGVGLNHRAQVATDVPRGSGGGLALHTTMLAIIGGDLIAEATAAGTRVTIHVPLPERVVGH